MEDYSWDFKHSLVTSIIVDTKIREERKSICNSCDKLTYYNVCSVCNCFMPVKTWVTFSKCPLDKWKATKSFEESVPQQIEEQNEGSANNN